MSTARVRRRTLSLRARWALWVALLTSAAGIIVLALTVALTARMLHDRAPRPAAPPVPIVVRPGQRPPPTTAPTPAPQIDQGALVTRTLQDVQRYASITLGGLVLASIAIAWTVAGRMLQPLAEVTEAARSISGAADGRRIAMDGPHDELRELADTFDAMLARVDATFAQQQTFVANASHELRTPLSLLQTEIDVALLGNDPAEQRDALREMRKAVERMTALVERLLHLSRAGTLMTVEPYDLALAARRAITSCAAIASDPAPIVRLDDAPVTGDAVLLDQLASNLLENAYAYRQPGGSIWMTTSVTEHASVLVVENEGLTVPPEQVAELFDRFRHRSANRRTAGGGFGLGLTIVSTIARTHGGVVQAVARPTGGLRVEVRLARTQNASARATLDV